MQKFKKGDLVRIAKDLGSSMSHFQNDCEAIVMYSYNDRYGGGESQMKSFCLHIKGRGETSWYEEHQLTLLESGRLDLLEEWEMEEETERKQKADIDWIFSHGEEVLKGAHGATIAELAKGIGITNLWGNHGEGFVYYQNAMFVLGMAKPYLETNDKEGWLKYCEEM